MPFDCQPKQARQGALRTHRVLAALNASEPTRTAWSQYGGQVRDTWRHACSFWGTGSLAGHAVCEQRLPDLHGLLAILSPSGGSDGGASSSSFSFDIVPSTTKTTLNQRLSHTVRLPNPTHVLIELCQVCLGIREAGQAPSTPTHRSRRAISHCHFSSSQACRASCGHEEGEGFRSFLCYAALYSLVTDG